MAWAKTENEWADRAARHLKAELKAGQYDVRRLGSKTQKAWV